MNRKLSIQRPVLFSQSIYSKFKGLAKGCRFYSIAHYIESNGDLIADPDLVVIRKSDVVALLPLVASNDSLFHGRHSMA